MAGNRRKRAGPSLRFEAKIRPPADAQAWAAALPRPLVFTNGVFDILHRGHVTYLAQARALGASLLVAANSDASARGLGKAAGRPVNALEDRLAVLAALEAVTLVTWFEEETPLGLILAVKPDVLVKGGDWKPEAIVGAKASFTGQALGDVLEASAAGKPRCTRSAASGRKNGA